MFKKAIAILTIIILLFCYGCEKSKPSQTDDAEDIVIEFKSPDIIDDKNIIIAKTVYVWIPKTGKRYHNNSKCSNMKNPSIVTKEAAIKMGYTPCSKCY